MTGVSPYEDAQSLYDLVDKIQQREVNLDLIRNENARAVVKRMLDKNPDTRVTIEALIQMDWVTNNGTEPLQIDVVEKTDGKQLAYARPERIKPIQTGLFASRSKDNKLFAGLIHTIIEAGLDMSEEDQT